MLIFPSGRIPLLQRAAALVSLAAAALSLSCGQTQSSAKTADAPPLGSFDYETIVRDSDPTTIALGPCPMDLAFDGQHLWVIDNIQGGAPLHRVDTESREVKHFLQVGKFNTAIAIIDGDIWLTSALENKLYQVRRSDGKVIREYGTGDFPYQLASNGKYVWTSNVLGATLTKVDTEQKSVSTVSLGGAPHGLLFFEGLLWVRNTADGTLLALDPETDVPKLTVKGPNSNGLFSTHGEYIWMADYHNDSVTKIDPVKGEVVGTYPVGRMPWKLASDGRRLWVTNSGEDTVSQIDPETGSVIRTVSSKGPEPLSIIYVQGRLWLVNSGDENLLGNLAVIDAPAAD